ncbi:hypothetical protein B9Z55_015900 [Caenorhabditis nigoni]|uniref:UBC core domain-containing protein n=1 Tax=Caenorhabditis nigoni TaxID=1611254 RepID=A0A2G5UCL6_9PELO|nr:hypothetical protein B9Z55_015900 [Caenorhabditis nigoni]
MFRPIPPDIRRSIEEARRREAEAGPDYDDEDPNEGSYPPRGPKKPVLKKRRVETDVLQLIAKNHDVEMVNNLTEFIVKFHGPPDSEYEDGVWKIRVELPEKYPFKSPSIGFLNKIFHPNIDEASGTVCLDVINQAWTALYDLSNVFETFLPQLLQYPNAHDPLNGEAARMYMHKPEEYKRTVREYVARYATEKTPAGAPATKKAQEPETSATWHDSSSPDDDDNISLSSLSEIDPDDVASFEEFEKEYDARMAAERNQQKS